jgi:hypothetical protein
VNDKKDYACSITIKAHQSGKSKCVKEVHSCIGILMPQNNTVTVVGAVRNNL